MITQRQPPFSQRRFPRPFGAFAAAILLAGAPLAPRHAHSFVDEGQETPIRVALPPPRSAGQLVEFDTLLEGSAARGLCDRFAALIETRSAYAARGNDRWKEALATLRGELGEEVRGSRFARELSRVLARVGDGHASLEGGPPLMPQRLPFLLIPLTAKGDSPIVAVAMDQSDLLDPQRPFVARFDGESIDAVLAKAATLVADASPQLVRGRACRVLGRIGSFRSDVERSSPVPKPVDRPVELVLVDAAGGNEAAVRLDLVGDAPRLPPWPPTRSGRLPDGTAILRLDSMDERAAEDAARIIDGLAPGEPLVIDVRGNRGGTRDALQAVATRLLPPGSPPIVFNAARPLLVDGAVPGELAEGLAARGLRPIDDPAWSDAERAAVQRFAVAATAARGGEGATSAAGSDARFGPLHVAVISPAASPRPDGDAAARPEARRVAVLCDPQCFSAADVFLAAMKEIPGVTLVGQPSGGGSGAAQRFDLGEGFSLRLSTMASFQPDGTPFDGFGVTPDIAVVPDPLDFTTRGSDRTLAKALELLRATAR